MVLDESVYYEESVGVEEDCEGAFYLESSDQPPPTRTMTVCDRKIRQKQSFGS